MTREAMFVRSVLVFAGQVLLWLSYEFLRAILNADNGPQNLFQRWRILVTERVMRYLKMSKRT